MTTNFENEFELISNNNKIDDRVKEQLINSINKIEEIATKYNDEIYSEKRNDEIIFSSELRALMEILIEILSNRIKNSGHIEEFEDFTNNDKIKFLNRNGYLTNKDTNNALHQIRQLSNEGSHNKYNDESKINKANIVSSIDYVSIIIHDVFEQKSKRNFKSDRYYLRGEAFEKVNETIKKNINDRTDKTIKINDERVIDILFDKKISFYIPLYQRGYSWTNDEINDLFIDIKKRIIDQNNHFFGSVTFIKFKKDNKNKIKIVDGQQRLTTLTLILKAIHEKYLKFYNDPNKGDDNLNSFISRKNVPLSRIDDKESIEIFEKIWKNKISYREEMGENNIFKAYKVIYNKIEKMSLEELDDHYTALKRFIVGINWTAGYNEFELFESLNSKGKILSDFDIFKNYLFSIVEKGSNEEENEEKLAKIFYNMIQIKINQFDEKKREKITSEFLKNIIRLNNSKPSSGKKIFSQFKSSFENKNKGNLSIQEYEKIIFEFSKILTSVILTQFGDKENWKNFGLEKYFDDFFILSNSTSYSSILIQYIIDERNFEFDSFDGEIRLIKNPKEFTKILNLLEIWKVKRDVAHNEGNETIGSYIHTFNDKIKKRINNENLSFFEILKDEIEKEEGFLRMPSQDKFYKKLSGEQLANTSVVKYLFYRMEQKSNHIKDENFVKKLKHYPIIPRETKDRNDKLNRFIEKSNIYNVELFDMIGNYFVYGHGENSNIQKKFKDSNRDLFFLIDSLKKDNISININEKYDEVESIKEILNVNNEIDYERFIKQRSEQIANICNEIFNEKNIN